MEMTSRIDVLPSSGSTSSSRVQQSVQKPNTVSIANTNFPATKALEISESHFHPQFLIKPTPVSSTVSHMNLSNDVDKADSLPSTEPETLRTALGVTQMSGQSKIRNVTGELAKHAPVGSTQLISKPNRDMTHVFHSVSDPSSSTLEHSLQTSAHLTSLPQKSASTYVFDSHGETVELLPTESTHTDISQSQITSSTILQKETDFLQVQRPPDAVLHSPSLVTLQTNNIYTITTSESPSSLLTEVMPIAFNESQSEVSITPCVDDSTTVLISGARSLSSGMNLVTVVRKIKNYFYDVLQGPF